MIIWLPILWMAAGFCLFAGIHFLLTGHSQQNARLFPVFGVLCILLAVYLGVSAVLQTPAANAPWVALERLHITVACLVYPTAVWFFSLYSRLKRWRAWVFGSAAVFGVLLLMNLTGDHGLLRAQAETRLRHMAYNDLQSELPNHVLLQQAYAALHVAKGAGHHELAAFTGSMQTEAERRLRLETDLRVAIERKQLQLVYQPQVDRDGRLVGAEALLRWQHPAYGAIDPLELVQMAQDSGQMQAMGRLVLDAAFATLAALPVRDRFRLAVNISPWQLFFPDFLETVQAAIRAAAVDPTRITLEITETAFIHDIADAAAKIRALDAMGICVSIDDFGTGYASIASLKAFPVRELKIDQTFIRDMSTTQPDRFVTAMIAMGRALNLQVVAEGVEHEAQRDALVAMGCDVLQGYLISKPITATELAFRARDGASVYSSESKPGYA